MKKRLRHVPCLTALFAFCTLSGCSVLTDLCVQCVNKKVNQWYDEHLDDSPRTEQCTKLKKTVKEAYSACSSGPDAPCSGATCALAEASGLPRNTSVGDLEPVFNRLLDSEEDDAQAIESAFLAGYRAEQQSSEQSRLFEVSGKGGGVGSSNSDGQTTDWDTICAKLREIKRKCANAHPIPVNFPLPPQCEGHSNPA